MIGATLGAGVGRYQGLHSLIIDALISVRMVTATGDVINVSATENPDLFWGLRGAGFNFGIVLSATYKVADLTNRGNVMNADFIFPASANLSYFRALKTFQDRLPAPLSLFTLVDYNTTLGAVSSSLSLLLSSTLLSDNPPSISPLSSSTPYTPVRLPKAGN